MKLNSRRLAVKNVLRGFGIMLLGLVLAGCSSGFEQRGLESQAFSLGTYRKVTFDKKFIPPSSPEDPDYNCVTTELSMPGQGLRAMGSTGGLTYTAFASSTTAGAVGEGFKSNFFSTFATNPQNTEILIVDDFGSFSNPRYTLPSALFTGNDIQALINNGTLTHGALVMRHANDVVKGSALYPDSSQTTNGQQTIYARGSGRLSVKGVNTRLLNQEVIVGKIKITTGDVAEILAFLKTAPSKVVNMSFVLIPCEVFEDFALSRLPTLEAYIEALAKVNSLPTNLNGIIDASGASSAGERTLIQRIISSTNETGDPLKNLIDSTSNVHIYVGASGNYGLPYSMYPALWPGVVNVTGSAVENPTIRAASLFNRGEVMTLGSLFRITNSGRSVFYFGTSYSAPSVSVFSALDLAGLQRCTDSQTYKSELALDTVSLVDRRLETATGAVQTRCGAN
jgi:hypothetical protein